MADRTIVRLAEIARGYDQAGKPHHADIIEDAMIRLSQSAVGNWWNGVKQVGEGIEDDAKAAGNVIAAPFEGAGAAASAAWNRGIKDAPQAAAQAEGAAANRAIQYTQQGMQDYQQAAPALAGPGGTGLPGAAVADAASGRRTSRSVPVDSESDLFCRVFSGVSPQAWSERLDQGLSLGACEHCLAIRQRAGTDEAETKATPLDAMDRGA